MELIDVVRKLIGPIQPIGETNADDQRLENLEAMAALVDSLLSDIDDVAVERHRVEFSRRRAGEFAANFFDRIGIKE